jgi:glyoxylase-like metal-dependent hydrolase (beta-lactamase superfamily II)
MIHEILPVGLLECNCSIFGDEASREAIVVDPGDDVAEIQRALARHGLRVTAIVVTHAHIDHIGGAHALKAATGAPVYLHASDLALYEQIGAQAAWLGLPPPERAAIDVSARDGDRLRLGEAEFHLLHTPGHTQGSICLWIPSANKLVAGDTLFRESIGRTDLPGGDSRRILVSIREKLLALPDTAEVVPGHGPGTTIGHEKEFNFFLRRM